MANAYYKVTILRCNSHSWYRHLVGKDIRVNNSPGYLPEITGFYLAVSSIYFPKVKNKNPLRDSFIINAGHCTFPRYVSQKEATEEYLKLGRKSPLI